MKIASQKKFSFAGKSLLWSLLLYMVMMVALNWPEVKNSLTGKCNNAIVRPQQEQPGLKDSEVSATRSEAGPGVFGYVAAVLKAVSGFAGR